MAARRSVLNGTSAWEREEKTSQQRDYAAQLQEQILQKQARQEQEKARRQQEQHEELKMLERERAAATRKRQPHQEQKTTTESSLPAPSPQRVMTMPQMPIGDSQQHGAPMVSPLKSVGADPGTGTTAGGLSTESSLPAPNVGSEAYMPAFSSAPSVFESILREPGIGARSITFYEDLTALHKLAAELDLSAKQRRTEAQNHYVKPNFLCQQEVSTAPATISPTASHPPDRLSDDMIMQKDIQLNDNHPAISQTTIRSNLDGLRGESVLLPLTTSKLSPSFSHSKKVSRLSASPHRQFVASMETEDDMASMGALDNSSEMLRFTAAKS
ncbi:hypothetical protein PPTG_08909 [Phytophthora nicotianae INRA-310]|uniref:Uncharacterized protein n=1 Tax=Phytophthora nicotianae (strain INRA-310) TaxID=761204 RepID=W2QKX1_PHYN3|nr:hypothetical protein PPTG_08909 [Phytophthora nicotianae INRA-310]ETN12895.1 hypothetical protein PPTG_08909 [Phytophthora nicotianae INRA-310]